MIAIVAMGVDTRKLGFRIAKGVRARAMALAAARIGSSPVRTSGTTLRRSQDQPV
jgi:hypothetical protein